MKPHSRENLLPPLPWLGLSVTGDVTSHLRGPHRRPNAPGNQRHPLTRTRFTLELRPPAPGAPEWEPLKQNGHSSLPFFTNHEGAGLESRDGTAQRSHLASCLQLGGGGHPAPPRGREGAADLEHPLGSGLDTVSGFFRSQGDSGEMTGTVFSLRGGGSDQRCHLQGIFLSCFCATCLLPYIAPAPAPSTHTLWPTEAQRWRQVLGRQGHGASGRGSVPAAGTDWLCDFRCVC